MNQTILEALKIGEKKVYCVDELTDILWLEVLLSHEVMFEDVRM